MSVKMKFGSKDIPFVYKGDKLIYPNPIKDGLLLWYDFKGIRNTDTNKEVAKDLSGNGNDGTLTNFNFTEGSGYKDNTLVFDGVDDKLIIPEIELDETSMSVMHDGKIYSYEDDKVLATKDYSDKELTYLESLRAKGRNLLRDSYIKEDSPYFSYQMLNTEFSDGTLIATNRLVSTTSYPRIMYRPLGNLIVGEQYTISFKAKADSEFSASFWIADANGGNSQITAKMTPYTKKWEIYSYTFTVNERFSDSTAIQWWVNKTNPDTIQTLYLKEVKLEKGTVATDWSPAPEDIREELPGLEVGGRNLLLKSNELITGTDYMVGDWELSEDFIEGDSYTVVAKGIPRGGARFRVWQNRTSSGSVILSNIEGTDYHIGVFESVELFSGREREFRLYNWDSSDESVPHELEWVALYKGDVKAPLDWTPAPEDFQTTSLSPSSLSNLQLYNRPLRKDELLHNAESKGLKELVDGVIVQDGLALHYDFSHESNTSEYKDKAFDYSGNGNHGQLQNFNFTEESGYVENKLKFDGVDDWLETQKFGLAQTSGIKNWTFDFTLDLQSESTRGSILNVPFNPERLSIKSYEDAIAIGRYYNGYWWGRTTPTLNRGKNNIVILCELLSTSTQETSVPSMNLTVYVNGEIVELLFAPSSAYYSNITNFLHVGWQTTNASQPQNAYLDEGIHSIKIYPRLLAPEEITHNYQIEKEKFNIVEGEM